MRPCSLSSLASPRRKPFGLTGKALGISSFLKTASIAALTLVAVKDGEICLVGRTRPFIKFQKKWIGQGIRAYEFPIWQKKGRRSTPPCGMFFLLGVSSPDIRRSLFGVTRSDRFRLAVLLVTGVALLGTFKGRNFGWGAGRKKDR